MSKPGTRPVIISGNWKMNHESIATEAFFKELKELLATADGRAIGEATRADRLRARLYPPLLSIKAALVAREPVEWIAIGAQNVHWAKSGAYTGEISTSMLLENNIRHVLTGHSERRQYFCETDETVRGRTERALEDGLEPTVCIGETREERESGRTEQVLERQLDGVFGTTSKPQAASRALDGRVLIAYEPVWAIGTGLTATPQQAQEAHAIVRAGLARRFGAAASARTPILYGGSVKPDNIAELLACPDVDGALVGGASLKAKDYFALLLAGARA